MNAPTDSSWSSASDKAQDEQLMAHEVSRLEAAFRARLRDDRPLPTCIAKAYCSLIEKRRAELLALNRKKP